MGPTLLKKQHNGTLYCLKLLPFGGACVMEGEDGESENERAFGKASLPRRMLIVAAGALMNFLIGFLIVLAVIRPNGPEGGYVVSTLDSVDPASTAAAEGGLQAGDEILRVDVYKRQVIHRESIVHSAVEFDDGAVLAQLGLPDMRLPIQYALTWPQRAACKVPRLRLAEAAKLTFFAPDYEAFPALGLAPVSYTHLDVYKRQRSGRRTPKRAARRWSAPDGRTTRTRSIMCLHSQAFSAGRSMCAPEISMRR